MNGDLIVYNGSPIKRYGEDDEVKSLGARLMRFHPAAREVGESAMLAAAQLALMYGANPLPGNNELHIWKDNKNRICIQLGIGYYTRLALQQGGMMWHEQPRPMTADERKLYGVGGNDIAWICRGYRADDWRKNQALSDEQVWRMFGATGIGICGAEYAKAGRPLSWTAEKRARADLYRRLFPAQLVRDIPTAVPIDDDEMVIDGSQGQKYGDINADLLGIETLPQLAAGTPAEMLPPESDESAVGDDDEEENDGDGETTTEYVAEETPPAPAPDAPRWSDEFITYCSAHIARYKGNQFMVQNALRKLFPGGPATDKIGARQQFEALKAHAAERDAATN